MALKGSKSMLTCDACYVTLRVSVRETSWLRCWRAAHTVAAVSLLLQLLLLLC